MKRILNLQKATDLKNILEDRRKTLSIDYDNKLIEKHNSITVGNNRPVDIEKLRKNKEMKSSLLKILYLAIMSTNLKKSKDEENCNAWYIKTLSELEREKSHLLRIDTTEGKINEPIVTEKVAFLKLKDILESTRQLDKDIRLIREKVAKFNKDNNISIEITKEMSDFLDTVEN